MLRELLKEYGSGQWRKISEILGNRTARQCRERFKHYLKPGRVTSSWSVREDEIVRDQYDIHGPHWSMIADLLPGRSDVDIRNRWSVLKRRRGVFTNCEKAIRATAVADPESQQDEEVEFDLDSILKCNDDFEDDEWDPNYGF
jgi:AMMECR1 domain-containing protein